MTVKNISIICLFFCSLKNINAQHLEPPPLRTTKTVAQAPLPKLSGQVRTLAKKWFIISVSKIQLSILRAKTSVSLSSHYDSDMGFGVGLMVNY